MGRDPDKPFPAQEKSLESLEESVSRMSYSQEFKKKMSLAPGVSFAPYNYERSELCPCVEKRKLALLPASSVLHAHPSFALFSCQE